MIALGTIFLQTHELHRRAVHRRVLAVHLRHERPDRAAHGGARQQDRRRRAWRSRWSPRCCTSTCCRGSSTPWLIALGLVLGTAIGVPAARNVHMTAMPQMVALFNGVGGGAVALIAWIEYRHHFGGDYPLQVEIPSLFAAIVGSISFWGSNIAFAKLQEILPGRPIKLPGPVACSTWRAVPGRGRLGDRAGRRHSLAGAVHPRDPGRRGGPREHGRAADRRRRHAGRDLAAERLHRPVRGRHRDRAGQHRADRRRDDRRRVGHDPHQPDGQGDEPLGPGDRRRRLRRRRRRARGAAGRRAAARCARPAPRTSPSSSPTRAWW